MTLRLEQALRLAAAGHAGQERRGGTVPVLEHVMAVAWILDRAGFDEDVVIAGVLHDLVEDTSTTLEEIARRFGRRVADLVADCSEQKTDSRGRKRPWIDRKRDHLKALQQAPVEALGIILADKLHNLLSIAADLEEGHSPWDLFHADREQVLWYYRAMIDTCGRDDARLSALAASCREWLASIETAGP
jgi:(p)ppGpp synthase/HD superfamily hydrolase